MISARRKEFTEEEVEVEVEESLKRDRERERGRGMKGEVAVEEYRDNYQQEVRITENSVSDLHTFKNSTSPPLPIFSLFSSQSVQTKFRIFIRYVFPIQKTFKFSSKYSRDLHSFIPSYIVQKSLICS